MQGAPVSATANDAALCVRRFSERRADMLTTILIVVLILMLLGAVPRWPHSKNWGYYPSGGLGLVLLIVLILVLMGRL
jgi:uncharacterized membrane protein YhaH (DUF805 family)